MGEEQVKTTLQYIRKHYKWGMIGSLVLGFLLVLSYGYFREYISFSQDVSLMSKSVLIILFLISIPIVVTVFNQKLRGIPLEWTDHKKLKQYRLLFNIKIFGLFFLSVLALVVFIMTGDFEMLIFWVATILFLYFDRPGYDKIQTDLRIGYTEEQDPDNSSGE